MIHKKLYSWLTGITISILFALAVMAFSQEPGKQVIRYNHKIHIEEAELICTDCHVNVLTNERASIPNIDICSDCHDDTEVENPEEKKVAEYVEENKRIPWIQVHLVPDYALFSHRRHAAIAKIECKDCHGEVAKMETPFLSPHQEITMDWCLNCHRDSEVSTDCYACHR